MGQTMKTYQNEHDSFTCNCKCRNTLSVCSVPVKDAHRGLSVFDQAHSAVAVPLVLDGHAADLHHHFPQLLGRAPTLLRTWELFACRSQELTELSEGNRQGGFNKRKPQRTFSALPSSLNVHMSNWTTVMGLTTGVLPWCMGCSWPETVAPAGSGNRSPSSSAWRRHTPLQPPDAEADLETKTRTSHDSERVKQVGEAQATNPQFPSTHHEFSSPGILWPGWPGRAAVAPCCPRPPSSRERGPPAAASRSASPAAASGRTQ